MGSSGIWTSKWYLMLCSFTRLSSFQSSIYRICLFLRTWLMFASQAFAFFACILICRLSSWHSFQQDKSWIEVCNNWFTSKTPSISSQQAAPFIILQQLSFDSFLVCLLASCACHPSEWKRNCRKNRKKNLLLFACCCC